MAAFLETDLFYFANRLLSFEREEYNGHPDLSPDKCMLVCQLATQRLSTMDACIQVRGVPINVVGDIHGQFHDLLRIFDKVGPPPETRFLFLGDYVDRGKYSLEVITLLLTLMLMYPESVYLLRGNHEASNICWHYGFKDEVFDRYGDEAGKQVLTGFLRCFQWLPFAAIINDQILCCHGGLSPSFLLEPFKKAKLGDFVNILNNYIQRPMEPPTFGPACDLLWADPDMKRSEHRFGSEDKLTKVFWSPSNRGCSYNFSLEALTMTLNALGISVMVRGHQVADEGHLVALDRRCITVFSAPGYSGMHQNNGSVLQIITDQLQLSAIKGKLVVRGHPGHFIEIKYIPNRPFSSLFHE